MEQELVYEEVQSFSPELAEALRRLVSQEGTRFQPLTDEDIKGILKAPQTHLFVARRSEDSYIVGTITLVLYRIPYRMKGIIEDLVVDSEFRHRGIGEKLLNSAINCARENDVQLLILTSSPEREAANRLYQKLGFMKRDTNVYQVLLSSR